MVAVLGQAPLAGLALSGDGSAVAAHMINGGVALSMSALQVVFGVILKNQLPRWVLTTSFGLLLGEGIQVASGRLHLFVVHLPLGLALFAGLARLALWICTGRAAPAAQTANEEAKVRSLMIELQTGGK